MESLSKVNSAIIAPSCADTCIMSSQRAPVSAVCGRVIKPLVEGGDLILHNKRFLEAAKARLRRFSYGIVVLAVLCGGVLILFGGVTDRLIPLYAVGAFLAFTLSQAGMVMHWRKNREPNWLKSALVNGLGAFVAGTTTGVVLVAKFVEGAWITLLFIPLTIGFFAIVRRHYHSVKLLTTCKVPVDAAGLSQHPIAVIAIDRWSNITRQGIEFAARLSPEVIALHVEPYEHSELLQDDWEQYVERPFRAAGKEPPQLHLLPPPYRFIVIPVVQFVLDLSKKHPDRSIVVVIPELVEDR